jgi:hypothetical protein
MDSFFNKLMTLLAESELSYVEMIGALEVMKAELINEMGQEGDDDEA